MNNNVGLLSAKEIIGGGFILVDLDIYLNTKYLSKELYDFRCLQYKKYAWNEEHFCNHYSDLYKLFLKQKLYVYEYWLFDFVMNGGLDNERKK